MLVGKEFTACRNEDLSAALWPIVGEEVPFGKGKALVTSVSNGTTVAGPVTDLEFTIDVDAHQALLAEVDKSHPPRDSDRQRVLNGLLNDCLDKMIETLKEAAKPSPEQVAASAVIDRAMYDLAVDFLYYDRKEDEDLPRAHLYAMIDAGESTLEKIAASFRAHLLAEFDRNRP